MGKVVKMPDTKTFEMGGLTLQLRLDGRSVFNIEKRMDKSLLSLFMSDRGGMKMPPVNDLLIVLQGANKTHGIKDKDMITALETFLDNGGTTMEIQEVVQELLDEAGFFGKEETSTESKEEPEETLDNNPAEEESLL